MGRKEPSWQQVDKVLDITEPAALVLQALAAIGQEGNASRLLVLKEKLSLQHTQTAEPATITLPYLVRRARSSDLGMVQHRFNHIMDLVHLCLWLDQ
jgi:hypothetical protein